MTTFTKDFGNLRFSHTVCNKYWNNAIWEWRVKEMQYVVEEHALRMQGKIQSGLIR